MGSRRLVFAAAALAVGLGGCAALVRLTAPQKTPPPINIPYGDIQSAMQYTGHTVSLTAYFSRQASSYHEKETSILGFIHTRVTHHGIMLFQHRPDPTSVQYPFTVQTRTTDTYVGIFHHVDGAAPSLTYGEAVRVTGRLYCDAMGDPVCDIPDATITAMQ